MERGDFSIDLLSGPKQGRAMRILLANAPLEHGPRFPIPSVIRDKGKDMPLGLLYLAAALKNKGFDNVAVLDAHSQRLSCKQTIEKIIQHKPDFLGLTVTSFSCYDVFLLTIAVRKRLPDCHICLGGPSVTLYPEKTLTGDQCDSICSGYGEKAIAALVGALEANKPINGIPGIGINTEAGPNTMSPLAEINIDALPFPERSLIEPEDYTSWIIDRPMRTTATISSRGCPFRCNFCTQSRTPFSQRSVENVIAEVEKCIREGYAMINFEDDCMNLDPKWMFSFCEQMVQLNNRPAWGFRGRVAGFDRKLAKACVDAGCVRINFGVESGSKEIQEQIGKGITIRQAAEAIEAAKNAGISTVCYFILGFPEETESQMDLTISFAKTLCPDFAQFTPLVLLPGTRLYEREQSIRGEDFDPYGEYAHSPTSSFSPPEITGSLPRKTVIKKVRKAYFDYYFVPGFLFSGKGIKGGILRGIRAGLSLLSYVLFGPVKR